MMECPMTDMGGGAMGMMMALGLLGTLLVLAAIAGLAYLVVRAVVSLLRANKSDAAIDELRRAYARGEIDREEYEQRMEVLGRLPAGR